MLSRKRIGCNSWLGTDMFKDGHDLRCGTIDEGQWKTCCRGSRVRPGTGHAHGTAATMMSAVRGPCLSVRGRLVDSRAGFASLADGLPRQAHRRHGVEDLTPAKFSPRFFDNASTLRGSRGGCDSIPWCTSSLWLARRGLLARLERFDELARGTPLIANTVPPARTPGGLLLRGLACGLLERIPGRGARMRSGDGSHAR